MFTEFAFVFESKGAFKLKFKPVPVTVYNIEQPMLNENDYSKLLREWTDDFYVGIYEIMQAFKTKYRAIKSHIDSVA